MILLKSCVVFLWFLNFPKLNTIGIPKHRAGDRLKAPKQGRVSFKRFYLQMVGKMEKWRSQGDLYCFFLLTHVPSGVASGAGGRKGGTCPPPHIFRKKKEVKEEKDAWMHENDDSEVSLLPLHSFIHVRLSRFLQNLSSFAQLHRPLWIRVYANPLRQQEMQLQESFGYRL